jgi:hypothetical protein
MNDLDNNFARFLLSLGATSRKSRAGLPCPAYIKPEWSKESRINHWREASATGQLETPTEVDTNTFGVRNLSERTFPSRGAPGTATV